MFSSLDGIIRRLGQYAKRYAEIMFYVRGYNACTPMSIDSTNCNGIIPDMQKHYSTTIYNRTIESIE